MTRKTTAALLTVLVMIAMPLFADKKEKKETKVSTKKVTRINNDVNRLESILVTAQNSAIAFPKPTLTKVANEANSLANRIWADAHKLPNRAAVAAANRT